MYMYKCKCIQDVVYMYKYILSTCTFTIINVLVLFQSLVGKSKQQLKELFIQMLHTYKVSID